MSTPTHAIDLNLGDPAAPSSSSIPSYSTSDIQSAGPGAPDEESRRLAALHALALLDTPADSAFDDLTALAAELLGTPMAMVSFVDGTRHWFKSRHGLDPQTLPRDAFFCSHAIEGHAVFEVQDAACDPRFHGHPLVSGAPHLRFYAGAPLRLDSGEVLGTLCVASPQPRVLTAQQRERLSRLARQAVCLIELHRLRRAHAQTSSELRQLALVAQHTDNVVILADTEGRATWVNAAFERVTGYRAHEIIGHQPGTLLQLEGASAAARTELHLAVRERRACRLQVLNRTRDGRPYWMNVDLQPLHAADGTFEGFVAIETDITEVVRQREHAQALLDVLPAGVMLQSPTGRIIDANPAAHAILGVPDGSLHGQDTRAVRWSTVDDQGHALRDQDRPIAQVLATGKPSTPRRIGVRNGQGDLRWLDLRCVPLHGPDGTLEGALTCFTDATDMVRTEGLLQTALNAADLGSWTWEPDDDLWTLSPNWAGRFGTDERTTQWRERVHADDMHAANQAMRALLNGERDSYRVEFRFRMTDGRWRWLLAYGAVAERSPAGRVLRVSGVMMDVDERRRAEERLRVAATTDALTGLPNRSLLADRLGRALSTCRRRHRQGALIYLDLDHFKRVNDSHGHAAGDALLREVTRRLRDTLRAEDTLARMGGDEMMVLLPNAGADAEAALASAHAVVHKLRAALAVPVPVAQAEYRVGASVGITVFPREDGLTVEDLIREADTAMYAAKQGDRGSTRVYEPTMREHVAGRLSLERALRQAIEADALTLHLQGQWTAGGQLAGLEALVRWHDAERGPVSPVEFIPLAEDSGLIVPLGRRVIEHACVMTKALRQAGIMVPLSVNISPRQFADPGFAAHLQREVHAQGIAPADLQLELTEGMLAGDASEALMRQLDGEGFRFSIDDFGTGWSNLMYLKRLPVHELKIDRAFVRDVVTDRDDAALVLAIIGIARRFGIRTVAEGVETLAQASFLLDAGCDRLQGWLFDRARPLAEVLAAPRSQPTLA